MEIKLLHRAVVVGLLWLSVLCSSHRAAHRRASPTPPAAGDRCRNPVGLTVEGAPPSVYCAGREGIAAGELLRRLGVRACRQRPPRLWLAPGDALALGVSCVGQRVPLAGRARLLLGLKLEINSATTADLQALPRIGPALARRIVVHRSRRGPFVAIDALAAVKGIGRATVRRLRPLVTVDPRARGNVDGRGLGDVD